MITIPDTISLQQLVAIAGSGGALDGAKVHLFKSPFTPTRTSVIGDFTAIEADFTGYAASAAIVFGTPYVDPTNGPQMVAPGVQFTAGSPLTVSNVIYGVYVTNGAGTTLLYAESFDSPISIAAAGQAIVYVPVFGLISQ